MTMRVAHDTTEPGTGAAGRPQLPDAPADGPALELRGVDAGYGPVSVLHGVDLVVPRAGVVALLGPNGAGKSTTLKVASGRLRATGGQLLVAGEDVTRTSAAKLARRGVCTIPEGRGVFPNLTVTENLRMWTYRGGMSRAQVEETTYARFPQLGRRRRQVAGTLSGGEQQMLAMSRALSANPTVLLLDEISMGLAPLIVAELYEIVGQLAADGQSILLVEQFARTALQVATHAAVMTHGRVVLQGAPEEISDAVLDVYLGGQHGG